jgi:2-C-methyl-D-erythritol 2,4-cyclodiphosphate synthase
VAERHSERPETFAGAEAASGGGREPRRERADGCEHRVGFGFDAHRFATGPRPLVLGGVVVPGERGLEGHSDADVVAHALADALLGAVGLPDLGELYPDWDQRFSGASSLRLLEDVAARVEAGGFRLVQATCTVVLEAPRLAPHRAAMSERLAIASGGPVAVTAKRPEGLGALGRGEGIACFAVALLARTPRGGPGSGPGSRASGGLVGAEGAAAS